MKNRWGPFGFALLIVLACFPSGFADVEWELQETLELDSPPVDMAISANGRWLFVLTHKGRIIIFSSDGQKKDMIDVGDHVDRLEAGPREDLLFLKSRKEKKVEVITLDFVQNINVLGSPFKGPANAAVVIAVFTDFE